MPLISDEEAVARLRERWYEYRSMWGTPIPPDVWIGPGAADEFDDGRGRDDNDSEFAGAGVHHH